MQTQRLNDAQIVELQKFLASWFLNRGPEILGSQLGTAIYKNLGIPVRDLGGLRNVVEQELSSLLEIAGTDPDLRFLIKSEIASTQAATDVIQGQELIRFFSNPKLEGVISVSALGEVHFGGVQHPAPEGFRAIEKPSVEEFRALSKDFADAQSAEVRATLASVLDKQDYNEWIATLKQLSTPLVNLSRNWEAVRADFVSRKLHDELINAGIAPIKAAEIGAKARAPRLKPSVSQRDSEQISTERISKRDDLSSLRKHIHAAIDVMSMDELRRLPIAAGIMFDALR